MKKDITICFRTSSGIRKYLQDIATKQRQSISYVIESLIYRHQQGLNVSKTIDSDRRRYKRKKVSFPAFIGHASTPELEFETASLLDISLGGIRFSIIPTKKTYKILPEDRAAKYSVIFSLPDESQPIRVTCRPKNSLETAENLLIGAAFVDADFNSYQSLQKYLI